MPRSIHIIDVPFYLELDETSFQVSSILNSQEVCTLISQHLYILGFTFELDKTCAEWTFSESVVLRLWNKNEKLVIEMRDLNHDEAFKKSYKHMKKYLGVN